MKTDTFKNKATVGWREWVALPKLGIPAIKAKLDTGARTSALHTFKIESFTEDGRRRIRFGIHPLQRRRDIEIFCVADVYDQRIVTDSGGHGSLRYIIKTSVVVGEQERMIQVSLTNRDNMRFRMLLGRTAIQGMFLVDPDASYLTGRSLIKAYRKTVQKRKRK